MLGWIGQMPRADATTIATTHATVTFIANPNLPKPPAPGLPPVIGTSNQGGKPIAIGTLPKTGDSSTNLYPVGLSFIFFGILLFLSEKKGPKH